MHACGNKSAIVDLEVALLLDSLDKNLYYSLVWSRKIFVSFFLTYEREIKLLVGSQMCCYVTELAVFGKLGAWD